MIFASVLYLDAGALLAIVPLAIVAALVMAPSARAALIEFWLLLWR